MVSISQLKLVIGDFLDQQIVPAIESSLMKWAFRGSSVLVINNLENVVAPYKEAGIQLGLIDKDLNLNVDAVRTFLENAFGTVPELKVNLWGCTVTFTKTDANVLINLLEARDGREKLVGSGDAGVESTPTEETGTVEQPVS